MTYIAIDLEMTGLKVKTDQILEIGAVRMVDGVPVDSFSALINPHCPIPEKITELTGITREMADKGDELDDILPEFLTFCGENPLLGHNVMFDYTFLKQAMVNHGWCFDRPGIDTLKLARRFLPGQQKKTLEALRDYYGLHTDPAHRAHADALAAALVYEKLFADFSSRDPEAFLPAPMPVNIKKQQRITIPQREQLTRLLSESVSSAFHSSVPLTPDEIGHLSRSEASRLIEQLLHPKA